MSKTTTAWTELCPSLRSAASREAFVKHARALVSAQKKQEYEQAIEEAHSHFVDDLKPCKRSDRQALLASGLVLCDLAIQGWLLRVRGKKVQVRAPLEVSNNCVAEKARIRAQELVRRNAQLRQPAVQKFLRSMEQSHLFKGKFSSIFSLMRDGRELSHALREARAHSNNGWAGVLTSIIDPIWNLSPPTRQLVPSLASG